MDNKYELFMDEGTTKLMEILSSPQIDEDEKAAIVAAFTSELENHISNHDTMPDYEFIINSISVDHVDKKLSGILAKGTPTYKDFETALALCNRLKALLAFFTKNGWELPEITNSNPDDCEKTIKQRQEDNLRSSKLSQLDQQIDEAIARAEREISTESCNAVIVLLDEMRREIDTSSKKRGSTPSVKNADTKALYKRVAALQKTAEQKEALHSSIRDTDAKLYALETMPNSTAIQWQEAIELCQQLKKLIADCRKKQWPLPAIRYAEPDEVQRKYVHYQTMLAVDQEISNSGNFLSSSKQYKAFVGLCAKQVSNIELCSKSNWKIPGLSNPNPNQLMQTAKQEMGKKERIRKLKAKLILAAAIVVAVLILIGVAVIKSREGKVTVPFSSTYVVSRDCADIQEELEKAGFTNIKTVASDAGWLDDDEVISVTVDNEDSFSKGTYYEPEVTVVITYSSTGRIDVSEALQDWQTRKYSDIVAVLKQTGFTNITTNEQTTSIKEDDQLIADISLNGDMYTNGHCYLPKNAPINITYCALMLNLPNSNASFVGQNYENVVASLKEDGFTNVQTEEIKTGWAEGNSVIAVTINNQTSYDESDVYAPDVKIVVKYSSNDRIETTDAVSNWRSVKYTELEKDLRAAGFTNITLSQTETTNKSQNHLVAGLTINGESFNAGECHVQKTAPIVIKYYTLKITIDEKASDIEGDNYTDVVTNLEAMGFTNITLKRANDLVLGWFSKEGAVQSISINGNTDFSAEDSFYYDAEIIIVVHTFKDKGCDDITIVAD